MVSLPPLSWEHISVRKARFGKLRMKGFGSASVSSESPPGSGRIHHKSRIDRRAG